MKKNVVITVCSRQRRTITLVCPTNTKEGERCEKSNVGGRISIHGGNTYFQGQKQNLGGD